MLFLSHIFFDVNLSRDKKLFIEVKKLFVTEDSKPENYKRTHCSLEFNPYDVMPGHSYFLGKNIDKKLEYQVIPLLKEYIKDGVLNENALVEIMKLTVSQSDKD